MDKQRILSKILSFHIPILPSYLMSLAKLSKLLHQINIHRIEDLFTHVETSTDSLIEMELILEPKTFRGSGHSTDNAMEIIASLVIAELIQFDSEIFNHKRARLRARFNDFGITIPKSSAMKLMEDTDGSTDEVIPPVFIDLITSIDNGDEEVVDISEKFLTFILSKFTPVEIETVFHKIGLSLIDEINSVMNPILFCAVIALVQKIPVQKLISNNEKINLSFIKIFEQIIIFNSDLLPNGPVFVSKLIRFYLSEKAIPFMAKNRMEMLAISMGKSDDLVRVTETEILQYESEDEQSLLKIIESLTPSSEYLEKLHFEFNRFNLIIKSIFQVDGQIYGSLANGFPTNKSDIDVVVNLPAYVSGELDESDPKNLDALNSLFSSLQTKFPEYEFTKIETARVPILKAKRGEIEIDISFNHEVVIANSALLLAYSSMSPKVRQLVVLIKYWAKQRDVNDSLQGTLSSYSYVLLVIAYLQKIYCLPDLQKNCPERLCDHGRCSIGFLQRVDYQKKFPVELSRLEGMSLKRLLSTTCG